MTGARRQSYNHDCDGTCIFHCNGIIIFTHMSSWIAARTTLPQIMPSCSADTAQKTVPETISSHLSLILQCRHCTKNRTGDNLISSQSHLAVQTLHKKQDRRQSHLISVSSCSADTAQKTVPETISSQSHLAVQTLHKKQCRRQSHLISQKQYRRQSHLISQKQYRKQFHLALQRTKRFYRLFFSFLAATDTTLLQTVSSPIIPLVSAY